MQHRVVPHGVQRCLRQLRRVCILCLVSRLPVLQQLCKALRQFCDTQHAASLAAMRSALQHMYNCTFADGLQLHKERCPAISYDYRSLIIDIRVAM
jgi:hypothetical protein